MKKLISCLLMSMTLWAGGAPAPEMQKHFTVTQDVMFSAMARVVQEAGIYATADVDFVSRDACMIRFTTPAGNNGGTKLIWHMSCSQDGADGSVTVRISELIQEYGVPQPPTQFIRATVQNLWHGIDRSLTH